MSPKLGPITRLDAIIVQRVDGTFTRRSAAEILVRHQYFRSPERLLVEDEILPLGAILVEAQVMEQETRHIPRTDPLSGSGPG